MEKKFVVEVLEAAKERLHGDNKWINKQIQELYEQADQLDSRETENKAKIKELDEAISQIKGPAGTPPRML
ncbi:hypothetical protein [Bacillus niameyensis]|uniref:hypothetical protein n=1 Tax=Bacillus niameyensis TaxID=1522308 RepID=UPI0007820C59|nr:hypothetical protein [Bacillus niameyensis]